MYRLDINRKKRTMKLLCMHFIWRFEIQIYWLILIWLFRNLSLLNVFLIIVYLNVIYIHFLWMWRQIVSPNRSKVIQMHNRVKLEICGLDRWKVEWKQLLLSVRDLFLSHTPVCNLAASAMSARCFFQSCLAQTWC